MARRREKKAQRKAEMAQRKRTTLMILGVTLAILAGIITIGALTEDDDSGKPNDALAAPVASSPASTDGNDEEIAIPSTPAAEPSSVKPVFYPSCAAVVAAGAAPLGQADRGFRVALDLDDDGQACELNGDDNPKPVTKEPTKAATTPPSDDDDDTGSGDDEGGLDPRFSTCAKANDAGYGPYNRGDAEYSWYRDRDKDGIVCEQ
jgi:hypothetical protein